MTDLRVPPEHQRGLERLQSLSDQQLSDFLSAIKMAARNAKKDSLAPSDLNEVPGISQADIVEILGTLRSLYAVRANADVPLSEFVSDICDFLQSTESAEFHLPKKAVGRFSDRLTTLLGIESLNRAAKAVVLRYEHERTLCTLRVLTDARPVFGNDIANRPEAVVIFHMLKIAYHEGNRVREIFFSLDENDLEELKKAILRAEVKAKTLKATLADAKIEVISPD